MEQRNMNINVNASLTVNASLVDCSLLGFVRVNEKNYSNKLNRLRIPTGRNRLVG